MTLQADRRQKDALDKWPIKEQSLKHLEKTAVNSLKSSEIREHSHHLLTSATTLTPSPLPKLDTNHHTRTPPNSRSPKLNARHHQTITSYTNDAVFVDFTLAFLDYHISVFRSRHVFASDTPVAVSVTLLEASCTYC
jgi:hypothetical protein